MRMHELKTQQPYFEHVWDGEKPWEIRYNDRDYQVGDILWLREFDLEENVNNGGGYSGREVIGVVRYILKDFVGLTEGYCCMSVKIIERRGF